MPNISNVQLSLQHGGAGTNRTANVTFTVSFTSLEILASEVFKADVSIKSEDSLGTSDRTLVVGTAFLHATSAGATATVTKTFTRLNLDEDADFKVINGHIVSFEDRDEWHAVVTVTPMVFSSATANSSSVTGSWGVLGQD